MIEEDPLLQQPKSATQPVAVSTTSAPARDLLSVPDPVAAPALPTPKDAASASTSVANNRELIPTTTAPIDLSKPKPGAAQSTVQANETVSGQLKELLSGESPYLEQGRQAGLRYASERGLQNSSFAAQAGEQARIAAALPIAQQDASTFSARNIFNTQNEQDMRTREVDHLNRLIETAQQGDINSRLQMEQFGFNSQLSAQENLQRLEQMAFAGDIDARQSYLNFAYQTMLADVQQGHAIALEDKRFQNQQSLVEQEFANALGLSSQESQQRIAEQNAEHQNILEQIAARAEGDQSIDSQQAALQLQGNYLAQVAQRQSMASQEIATIYQTEGLSSSQQQAAVRAAEQRLRDDLAMLGAYYAMSPLWDDDFFDAAPVSPQQPAGPSTPGGTPPGLPQYPPPTTPATPSPSIPRGPSDRYREDRLLDR